MVEHEKPGVSLCLIDYCSLEQHRCSPLHLQELLQHRRLQSSVANVYYFLVEREGLASANVMNIYSGAMNTLISALPSRPYILIIRF